MVDGYRSIQGRDGGSPVDDDDIAIAVHGVSKIYRIYDRPQDRLWESLSFGRRRRSREFQALAPLSFEVRRGETVAILGRNGSGKSTLLHTICGTLTPSTGRIETRGRVAALLELGAGFSPEFTGRENVRLNAATFGLSRAEVDARFDRIVEFAEIGSFIDQPLKTYSSGMVVRLAFAVLANIDADVLIIDEALAVGDVFFVQKCMRWLRGFMRHGTLLFVSHDTGAVVNLCDRAIWLHRGALIMDDAARLVAETYLQTLAEAVTAGADPATDRTDALVEAIRAERRDGGRASLKLGSSRPDAPSQAHDETPGEAATPARAASERSVPDRPQPGRPASPEPDSLREGRLELQWTDLDKRSFGRGRARIDEVTLLDTHDRVINSIQGGELVTLRIRCTASGELASPIVGFIVKDRLGQVLFGDNTFERYKHRPVRTHGGERIEARFTFAVPILTPGAYAIDVAIADGTQHDHVQQHWIHEAVAFASVTNHVGAGLIGLPMHEVTLSPLRADQPSLEVHGAS